MLIEYHVLCWLLRVGRCTVVAVVVLVGGGNGNGNGLLLHKTKLGDARHQLLPHVGAVITLTC